MIAEVEHSILIITFWHSRIKAACCEVNYDAEVGKRRGEEEKGRERREMRGERGARR